MLNSSFTLEICANGYPSALAAQLGGADRVELCDNLEEGGTTPSIGQVKICVSELIIPIFPIIRPRGGNFVYSKHEVDIMLEDIIAFKDLKCPGIVIGALDENNEIHEHYTQLLIKAAGNMEVCFHRAFDRTPNLPKSLNTLIELGIKRVLTSGGQSTAIEGAKQIELLVKQAANAIEIMPGSGVNPENIQSLKDITNATTYHTTAKSSLKKLTMQNNLINTTNLTDSFTITDVNIVKKLVSILK